MSKGREAFIKEIFNAINTIIERHEGNPVPISKIVYVLTTKYGCSELMIRKRLNNLSENGLIEIINDEVHSQKIVKKEEPSEVQGGF